MLIRTYTKGMILLSLSSCCRSVTDILLGRCHLVHMSSTFSCIESRNSVVSLPATSWYACIQSCPLCSGKYCGQKSFNVTNTCSAIGALLLHVHCMSCVPCCLASIPTTVSPSCLPISSYIILQGALYDPPVIFDLESASDIGPAMASGACCCLTNFFSSSPLSIVMVTAYPLHPVIILGEQHQYILLSTAFSVWYKYPSLTSSHLLWVDSVGQYSYPSIAGYDVLGSISCTTVASSVSFGLPTVTVAVQLHVWLCVWHHYCAPF